MKAKLDGYNTITVEQTHSIQVTLNRPTSTCSGMISGLFLTLGSICGLGVCILGPTNVSGATDCIQSQANCHGNITSGSYCTNIDPCSGCESPWMVWAGLIGSVGTIAFFALSFTVWKCLPGTNRTASTVGIGCGALCFLVGIATNVAAYIICQQVNYSSIGCNNMCSYCKC